MLEELHRSLDAIAAALTQSAPEGGAASEWRRHLRTIESWATQNREKEVEVAVDCCLTCVDAIEKASEEDRSSRFAAFARAGQTVLEVVRARLPKPASTAPAEAVAESPSEDEPEEELAAPTFDDPEIVHEFVTESLEQLQSTEELLLVIEKNPADDSAINAVFRCFHTIKGLAGFLDLRELEKLAHVTEDILDQARHHQRQLTGAALDTIFAAVDLFKVLIGELETAVTENTPFAPRHDKAVALIAKLNLIAESKDGEEVPSAAAESASASKDEPKSSTEAKEESEAAGKSGRRSGGHETIRIDAERLDLLVDLIGELVITESMVERAAEREGVLANDLVRQLGRMEKITRELQKLAGSLRMVPVRPIFQKMARLARDVAKKSGKRVDFQTVGAETELDKTVVDRIADPLVHMVRNAIDHGLESSEEDRVKAGKSAAGQVVLQAYHRGGRIVIEVTDDGRGMDREKIMKKARERGILREGEVLPERDVYRLVCAPGFSTAETISAISGRGVGMDVVKRQIDNMGGNLEINSELGKGTSFSMQLPLTLAVIDGMVIRIGAQRYIIPTLAVIRLVTPSDSDITTVMGGRGEALRVQDELVSVLHLDKVFDVDPPFCASLAVIVEADSQLAAIYVDEIIGQQQAVIKSMGAGLGEIPGVSGCAIMPDGLVGLVLDIAGLFRLATSGRPGPAAITRANDEAPKGDASWTH